jgi:hypothetical protein
MKYFKHEMALDYDSLAELTALVPEERFRDEMLLNSAHLTIERYTGRILSKKEFTEEVRAETGLIRVRQIPLLEVKSVKIKGMVQELPVKSFYDFNGTIFTEEYIGNNECVVMYTAGYTEETLPDTLREAVVKTFLYKKKKFAELESADSDSDEQITQMMSGEVKEMLEPYRRKTF